jgi:hypothetical protein
MLHLLEGFPGIGFKVNHRLLAFRIPWRQCLRIEGQFVLAVLARHKTGSGQRQVHVLEVEAGHVVSQLEKGVAIFQPGDFRIHHKRFDLTIHTEVSTRSRAVEVCLLHALDFDFSNRIADPLCRFRLCRLEEDFGGRL